MDERIFPKDEITGEIDELHGQTSSQRVEKLKELLEKTGLSECPKNIPSGEIPSDVVDLGVLSQSIRPFVSLFLHLDQGERGFGFEKTKKGEVYNILYNLIPMFIKNITKVPDQFKDATALTYGIDKDWHMFCCRTRPL